MTSLYKINEEIQALFDGAELNEETGEICLNLDKLQELEIAKEIKIENIIGYYKNQLSDATQLKAEAKNLMERAKTMTNKADRLKKYLADSLDLGVNADYGIHCVSWRKSEQVQQLIDSIDNLADDYKKVVVTPDKTAIKKAIKSGTEIEGFEVVENKNIQIK